VEKLMVSDLEILESPPPERRREERLPSSGAIAIAVAIGFAAAVALALLIYAGFCWALG
jgi:hypothetical protein